METLAIVLFSGPLSGIGLYSYQLARALAKFRPGVHLLMNDHFEFSECRGLEQVKIFGRTRRLMLDLIRFMVFVLRRHIRIIHLQGFFKKPLVTFFLIKLLKRVGHVVVFTAHDVIPHYHSWYHLLILKNVYRNVDAIIVHSESNKKKLLGLAPMAKHITVIPHGLFDFYKQDEMLTKETARQTLSLPPNAKVMLFFGRLDARKGAEAIIKEMPKLLLSDKEIHLLMAGRSRYPDDYLIELTRQNRTKQHVTIVDEWIADDQVNVYFSAADVVILPYIEGSTSGVLKVAMSFRKPVIATTVGELPEMVRKNDAGLLVDVPFSKKDVRRICEFMGEIITGRRKCYKDDELSEYSWARIARKTSEVYDAITEKNQRATA